MVKSTRRCGLQLLPKRKKKSLPASGSGASRQQRLLTRQTASILLLFLQAAPLNLESYPSKSRERNLLRHVKTIFLLDWQINFLPLGARPETKVHRSCRGPFLGGRKAACLFAVFDDERTESCGVLVPHLWRIYSTGRNADGATVAVAVAEAPKDDGAHC